MSLAQLGVLVQPDQNQPGLLEHAQSSIVQQMAVESKEPQRISPLFISRRKVKASEQKSQV